MRLKTQEEFVIDIHNVGRWHRSHLSKTKIIHTSFWNCSNFSQHTSFFFFFCYLFFPYLSDRLAMLFSFSPQFPHLKMMIFHLKSCLRLFFTIIPPSDFTINLSWSLIKNCHWFTKRILCIILHCGWQEESCQSLHIKSKQ